MTEVSPMDDTTAPLMPDYDPDWEARWDRANALFQQRKSEIERTHFTDETYGPAMEVLTAAGAAMQAAFIAQFRTVDEYRDWRLKWLWNWEWYGQPVPRMPDGLSLAEVRRRMAEANDILKPLRIGKGIGPEDAAAVYSRVEAILWDGLDVQAAKEAS